MVKRIVDVHSLEGIIEVAGMSGLYMTLDTIHMASLRDYVYSHCGDCSTGQGGPE